jgi:hypothetical protein
MLGILAKFAGRAQHANGWSSQPARPGRPSGAAGPACDEVVGRYPAERIQLSEAPPTAGST